MDAAISSVIIQSIGDQFSWRIEEGEFVEDNGAQNLVGFRSPFCLSIAFRICHFSLWKTKKSTKSLSLLHWRKRGFSPLSHWSCFFRLSAPFPPIFVYDYFRIYTTTSTIRRPSCCQTRPFRLSKKQVRKLRKRRELQSVLSPISLQGQTAHQLLVLLLPLLPSRAA